MSSSAEALLLARLGADVSGFLNNFGKAADAADSFAGKLTKVGLQLGAVALGAAAAAVALGAKFGAATIDLIDAQDDLAQRLGGTVNGLRALEIAAEKAGASQGALVSAAERLNKTIGKAKNGSTEAAAALGALGLTAEDLANLDIDRRLAAVAGRIQELGLDADQAQAKLNELGIKGAEALGLFTDGGAGILAASGALRKFGGALSDVDLKVAKQAKESMDNLSISVQGFKDKLAVALAPVIIGITNRIQELVAANGGWTKTISQFGEVALGVIGSVADGARGLQIVWVGLRATFGTIAEALLDVGTASAYVTRFIPGLRGFSETALDLAQSVRDSAAAARQELADLASQPMPSDNIRAFMDTLRQGSAGLGNGGGGAAPAGQAPGSEGLPNVAQALRDASVAQISPEDARRAELENLAAHYSTIEDMTKAHNDALATLQEQSQQSSADFSAQLQKQGLQTTASNFQKALALTATHNKKAFEANKALGIAQALVDTYRGVAGAMAEVPYPYNFAAAASVLAYGLAQVSAIKSQSFAGGGGGGGGGAGAAAAAPAAAQSGPSQGGSLLLVEGLNPSSLFSGKMVRDLASKLSDHVADGGQIRIL